MLVTLALMIIAGQLSSSFFRRIKVPGVIGMLLAGLLMGPFVLNIMDEKMLLISADLRKLALIIILLRAGLGISKSSLLAVGRPAFFMGFLPGVCEAMMVAFLANRLLGFTIVEGFILGFIIAAVSPAIVVPKMIEFLDEGRGKDKNIPTLVLAGASIDDVFAITLLSVALGLYGGVNQSLASVMMSIPLAIVLGGIIGLFVGWLILKVFNRFEMGDTRKVLYVLAFAILLTGLEALLKGRIEIAGLIGVMAIGLIILEKSPSTAEHLAQSYGKIWFFAEVLLFTLVGAQVNIQVAIQSGGVGIIVIFLGLLARGIGVYLSLIGTPLNFKERTFCAIAYIPKATVQAAVGGLPLMMGVANGEIILALAVLSIMITAPIGALGIHVAGKKLLTVSK